MRTKRCEVVEGPVHVDTVYPRWALYCSCGTTIFGDTEGQCKATWGKHKRGEL